jgi:cytochrome c-type biogenesis protein CcmH
VIWLALLGATVLCLTPLLPLLRARGMPRGGAGSRSAAEALYRAELAELEAAKARGEIDAAAFAAAEAEVGRRLLAAARLPEPALTSGGRGLLIAVGLAIPLAALALYLPWGAPFLPAAPLAPRLAEAAREEALIALLRDKLAHMDPASPRTREGYILLGNAESGRGHPAAAAEAWGKALALGFDPLLAAETAEAMSEAAGRVTPEAAALFRRALAAAPPNAPWRAMIEARLAGASP